MVSRRQPSTSLLIYFVSAVGLIVLQRRKVGEEGLAFRLPAGPLIPLAAIALVVTLMTTLAWREILAVLVVVAFAAVTYMVSKAVRRTSSQTDVSAVRAP
jgi:APA family basic amino acid/polyamine antiporter